MKVRVRYFASIREALGASETLDLPAVLNVGQLRDLLIQRQGAHAAVLARGRAVRCALNQILCAETEALTEGAEGAVFPPGTGG